MKALSLTIENVDIKLPSHADIVEGLSEHVDAQIAAFDAATIDAKLANLSNVYLGINGKAKDSDKADYATNAGAATYDQSGGLAIHEKYYKKTDVVDKAAADDLGNNFREKYAQKDGSYPNMTAGHATIAGGALNATLDSGNNNIRNTYIKSIYNTGGGTTITFEKGDGSKDTFQTKDTTYSMASASQAGLMSSEHFSKLNALSTDTSAQSVAHAATSDRWKNARTLSFTGAASASNTIDGSANITVNLDNINMSRAGSGVLNGAFGGTGQTDGTVEKLHSARSINGIPFDGSAGCSFHGTCETEAAVPDKVITLANYTPLAGNIIFIRFTYPNSADNPTLDINGTGAKPVYRGKNNSASRVSNLTRYAYQTVIVVDCTTYYRLVDIPYNISVELTGDVSGSANLNNDSISINTSVDPKKAMLTNGITAPKVEPYMSMNDINYAGFYRISNAKYVTHMPANYSSYDHTPFIVVFRSSAGSTFIQMLFDTVANEMWYRTCPNGEPNQWRSVSTTVAGTNEGIRADVNSNDGE